jgi:hypothetical protein
MGDMDTGSLIYYGALTVWSACIAYAFLFRGSKPVPKATSEPLPSMPERRAPAPEPAPVATSSIYESLARDGFKAFQTGEELTVDDVVKGLSRL